MSFIATISVIQNTFGQVEVTDTSDYTVEAHSAFNSRSLLVYKADGTMITIYPAFTFAHYPGNKIIFSLKKDYCLKIKMVLAPKVVVAGSKYTATEISYLPYYAKEYMTQLGLSLCRNPLMRSDINFYTSLQQYFVNSKLGALAADNLQQSASQFWLDRMGNTSSIIE